MLKSNYYKYFRLIFLYFEYKIHKVDVLKFFLIGAVQIMFKILVTIHFFQKFTTHERLEAHRKVHTGGDEVRPLTCSVCDRKLMNNSALACHMKTHSGDKFFDCPICDEKFDQVHNLKVHVKGHLLNGAYYCPKCSKKFTEYVHIRKHMKAVHGDKCFQCNQCPK